MREGRWREKRGGEKKKVEVNGKGEGRKKNHSLFPLPGSLIRRRKIFREKRELLSLNHGFPSHVSNLLTQHVSCKSISNLLKQQLSYYKGFAKT